MRFYLTAVLVSLGLAGCGQDVSVTVHDSKTDEPAVEAIEAGLVSGIDLANFDTSERPR